MKYTQLMIMNLMEFLYLFNDIFDINLMLLHIDYFNYITTLKYINTILNK